MPTHKNDQKHFRSNYIDIVTRNVPELYGEKEYQIFGEEENLSYIVLKHLFNLAKNTSSVVTASNTFTGASSFYKFYNPENQLTRVTPDRFTDHVLKPLGKSISGFRNKDEFEDFLLASALPHTHLNNVTTSFAAGYSSLVDSEVSTVALVEQKLIDKLGWVYLLNTGGSFASSEFPLSSILLSSLTEDLYYGKTYDELGGVQDLYEYLWRNRHNSNVPQNIGPDFLPYPYNQTSSVLSLDNFASGDGALNSLKTNLKIWLSPEDDNMSYFKDLFDNSLIGAFPTERETAGPFSKFIRALSYGMYDLEVLVRDLPDLLDVEECPPEFLTFLGNYLGWGFISDNKDSWRSQLRNAVHAYKAKGTRNSISYVMGLMIPSGIYTVDGTSGLQELYESYVPNLLYYLVKTESPITRSNLDYRNIIDGWKDKFENLGSEFTSITLNYDPNNEDNNARFLVDAILEYLHIKYGLIKINGKDYRESDFLVAQKARKQTPGYFHRGRLVAVPPWEDSRFYTNVGIREVYISELSSLMIRDELNFGLGISTSVATDFSNYLIDSTLPTTGDPQADPGFGSNNGFKFFTTTPQLPPNYVEIINRGEMNSASVFDYWSSKSSEIHIKLDLADIDFELDEVFR